MVRRSSGQGRGGNFAVQIILEAQDAASKVIQQVQASSEALGQTFEQISGTARQVFFIGEAFQQITTVINAARSAASGFYESFIQSNVELQEQLLSTQASLAATNTVLRGGVEITDPTQAIEALEGPVRATLEQIREDSLELVGVTSQQLVPIFQILAQESSAIGASLGDAGDLTVDFAAALGTLGIPLDFARQEIQSILQGQISADSQLAKSIGLNNEQVKLWRQQGVLVERLRERLEAFRAGNALAAQTIGGVTSNILEIFQEATRIAGEPLLEPIVEQLQRFYDVINNNRDTIDRVLGEGVGFIVEVFERLVATIDSLLPSFQTLGTALAQIAAGSAAALGDLLLQIIDSAQRLAPVLAPIIDLIGNLAQRFAEFADTGIGRAVIQITAIGIAIAALATGIAAIVPLLAGAAGAIATFAGTAAAAAGVGAVFVALREPITAVAVAVGRFLVGAFQQLQALFDQVRPSLVAFGQGIADFVRSLAPLGRAFQQGFLLSLELLGVSLQNGIRVLGLFVRNFTTGFAVIFGLGRQLVNLFFGPFIEALEAIGITGPSVFNGLKRAVELVFNGVVAALEKFASTIEKARELLRSLGIIQEDINPAFQDTADLVGEAAGAFDELAAASGAATQEIELQANALRELERAAQQAQQEIGRAEIRINADQSEQLAALQGQLNEGLVSEREFQAQREQITQQGLQSQVDAVSEQTGNLRAQYEALNEEQKAQATESLDQIQQLETQENNLRQQLGEQQLAEERRLRNQEKELVENAQSEANDAIAASVTQREIELQELRNQGLLSERAMQAELTKVNADRVDQTLAQEQQRLAELQQIRAGIADSESQEAIQAEAQIRESEQRILNLTKERLETESQLQEQAQEEILRAIDERAQAAQNAATRESQAIEQQISLYDTLTSSLEQQSRLLQAQNDLRNAANQQAVSNLNIAASLTKNEKEREQLQAQAAVEQLNALREQQEFENQSLQIQQQLEQLAVRRRQIEAEAAEIQARAALAQAEADRARTQAAFERGDANESDLEAADLGVQAAQAQIEVAQRRRGLADQEAALLPQQQAIARQRQAIDQEGAENQARADVITSLPEDSATRRRLERQERSRLLSDEQRRIGRSRRQTNQLAARALADDGPSSSGDRALSGTQPQLAGFDTAIAPLQSVQEDGNRHLEAIAANTARPSGENVVNVTVNVQGGQTNEQTGQSVAQVVRDTVERILDQASALQTA